MVLLIILIALGIAAVTSLLVRKRLAIEVTAIIATGLAFVGAVRVATTVAAVGTYSASPFFTVDALGAIIMLIIALVGFLTTIYSVQYLRQETAKNIIGFTRVRQYFILLALFLAAMFLAVTSSSPIITWISIEATTLSTAFLISFYNKPSAMEAAWKYLIINSIGLLLGFLGTLLYFTSIDATLGHTLVSWQLLTTNAALLNPLIAKIAFIFVLVGYGTKVGLVPLHTWLPDAHSKAPAPVSALLSGVLLNVALVVVLRFKAITDVAVGEYFSQNLLIFFGVASVFVATVIIITQRNYKRLLAYSSIENMGIIVLGFGFAGSGALAAIMHLIYHAFIKSALFLSAGTLFLKYSSTKIMRITGALTALPVTSILFFIGFFAITGTPPFGIFFTKFFILAAGMQQHVAVTIVVLVLMATVFVGFFKHVAGMIFGQPPAEIKSGEGSIWLIIPPVALLVIAFYLSFHMPAFLATLITAAVA